ncbi:hypothetical protein [Epilithonimonas mollis]|uniref:Uncharacterized protein n=1 Tax=Epilithonimonas mollis TaxID=216903 RepID=A0A1M6TC28_9FLAO|nr:hypothetical protein [Epilithonimonas mollis]SHK54547.1 hypothetical protein SAMN05444371_2782 [Epilithonimonas mollis]
MKNIINITAIAIMLSFSAKAQVAIGKNELSKIQPANLVTNPSIALEFYDAADNKSGIVLPWTSTVNNQPVAYNSTTGAGYRGIQGTVENGTLIFDLSDKNVKYRKDGAWFDLTNVTYPVTVKRADNSTQIINANNAVDSSLQNNIRESESAKIAIGTNSNSDTTPGILVLTDTNRAMVLPKVASPHLNIVNPAPGMMVFDTVKQQLAVFNGTVWSFWKP